MGTPGFQFRLAVIHFVPIIVPYSWAGKNQRSFESIMTEVGTTARFEEITLLGMNVNSGT